LKLAAGGPVLNTRKKLGVVSTMCSIVEYDFEAKDVYSMPEWFLELDVYVTVAPVWTACSTNAPELR
jgi:hypothetical protein